MSGPTVSGPTVGGPSDDDTITPLMVPDRDAVLVALTTILDAASLAYHAVRASTFDDLPHTYARTLTDVVNAFVAFDAAFAPPETPPSATAGGG